MFKLIYHSSLPPRVQWPSSHQPSKQPSEAVFQQTKGRGGHLPGGGPLGGHRHRRGGRRGPRGLPSGAASHRNHMAPPPAPGRVPNVKAASTQGKGFGPGHGGCDDGGVRAWQSFPKTPQGIIEKARVIAVQKNSTNTPGELCAFAALS